MARIEEYALLGDLQTAALVDRAGSIDWCCFPRFDSGACFAALLGGPEHGRWLLAPATEVRRAERRYRHETLILESVYETAEGVVRVIDFMPPRGKAPDIVRIVEGVRGRVPMRMELVIRFDYGQIVPWVRRVDDAQLAVAGPDALCFRTPVAVRGEDLTTVAELVVEAGARVPFVLTWFPSHERLPDAIDPEVALAETESYWTEWSGLCRQHGDYHQEIRRSLLVLKALTYGPTGGIVAAPTTSLPECIGGVRNWDYRYCWLRDATLTLMAMLDAGHREESRAWREWLLRTIAGNPGDVQIMYGIAGERRLPEWEAEWLPGYEGSRPVRIGNAASTQLQLDVYGEVLEAAYETVAHGVESSASGWALLRRLLAWLEEGWRREDAGIWEVRGPLRHFTHSKVMAWVAFDRAVRMCAEFGREGPVARWAALRDEIKTQVLARAWSERKQAFAQSYDSDELDASVLLMPIVGFLPADDPRMAATVEAIRRELTVDGFVLRYRTEAEGVDGLPPGEGVFLPCSFWLVEVLAMQGRREEARALFERLLALRNDLGLLAEEYDPVAKRQLGNFPQAFTHLALVTAALALAEERPVRVGAQGVEEPAAEAGTGGVQLREVSETDIPIFFAHQWDREATRMAAFPAMNREVFTEHWTGLLRNERVVAKTILFAGQVAGNIVSYEQDGKPFVGYWLGKAFWGKGIATRALTEFLDYVAMRPLYANVAKHNIGSVRVLEKNGFAIVGEQAGFLDEDGKVVEEYLLVLRAGSGDEVA
jgi:GH15 family glucan-1,4-alpha-glucosidase/RimJ/RimL family protein N-acetyltransferase